MDSFFGSGLDFLDSFSFFLGFFPKIFLKSFSTIDPAGAVPFAFCIRSGVAAKAPACNGIGLAVGGRKGESHPMSTGWFQFPRGRGVAGLRAYIRNSANAASPRLHHPGPEERVGDARVMGV